MNYRSGGIGIVGVIVIVVIVLLVLGVIHIRWDERPEGAVSIEAVHLAVAWQRSGGRCAMGMQWRQTRACGDPKAWYPRIRMGT
jgi:hypothetical protein